MYSVMQDLNQCVLFFSCRVEVYGSDADQTRMQPRIVNAKNFALVNLLQESCLFVIISTAGDGK